MGFVLIFISFVFLLTTFLDQNGEWYRQDVKIVNYILCPIFGLLGFLLVKSVPYYPKQYHEYYKQKGKIRE